MRRRPQRREREDITELFGDVIKESANQLYGDDTALDDPPDDTPRGAAPPSQPKEPAPERTEADDAAASPAPDAASEDDRADEETPSHVRISRGITDRVRRARAARAASGDAPPRSGDLVFVDDRGLLGQVAIWHGLATVLTLGFYRFWMKTEQRRLVWSHTKLDDEPFEYTGNGLELFIGAMIAVIFLAATLAAVNLSMTFAGLAAFGEGIPFAYVAASAFAVLPLIQYAIYRARRYRLSRTRWRGIRFGMDGSGLAVAGLWAMWMPIVALSAGLLWPFWRVARERYLTEHALWGGERFRFRGSALRLMPYWLPLWLLGAAPAAAVVLAVASESGAEIPAAAAELGLSFLNMDETTVILLLACAVLAAVLISVSYLAAETRLFMNARRIAGVVPRCTFGAADLWGAYGKVLLKSIWPGILVGAVMGAVVAIPMFAAAQVQMESFNEGGLVDGDGDGIFQGMTSWRAQGLVLLAIAINYILSALWGMWLWLAVYFRTKHMNLCAATSFAGLETLDSVRQRAEAEQADAEGFADAFDLGGI